MLRRYLSVVLVALATIPLWGANENTLTAESLVLPEGTTEAKLTVSLTNEAAISDIQFDLYLPTGFSVAYDEDDEPRIEVNTTRTTAKRHSVDYLEKTGFTRIMCTSSKGYTFSGNSGPVVDVYLTIDASVAAGTYNVDIKNIAVSNSENTYTPANTISTITIEGGGGSSTDNNSLAAASLSFDSGMTEGVLSVELNNEVAISDIQFDLYLPTGFSVAYDEDDEACIEVNTTRTTAKRHSVDYLEKTGFTRIMCTSSKGYTFSGNSGPVVDVYITKDPNVSSGTYNVSLKNIAISNSENTYTPADVTSQIVVSSVASHNIIYKVDGEIYETETYAEGATITPIAAPTREGYTFSGWSTIPAMMGDSDITVNGSFTVNAYKLTYYVDEEEYSSVNVNYGALVTPIDNPQKTGYTFSGWDEVPATMPAHDVAVRGTFTINQYTVTFKVDGEVYKTFTLDYGAAITAPATPTKEGYTFSGWQNVASTVPAQNVTYEASFTINKYTLKFIADGNVVSEESLDYGATITAPQAPDKTGYTFVTWGEVAATMPANDVTYTAQYSVNQYTVTFKIDGEIVKSETLDYGAAIVEPEVEQKEGATFSGWNTKVEETMPAHNVEYTGSYLVNPYTLTYIVDGEEYYHISVSYGSQLTPIDNPQKTGYTFSGWDEVPATMPAHDVTVRGTFTINQYTITFKVDGEVYKAFTLDYGATITAPAAPTKEGYTFSGWQNVASTVPAQNVTYEASFTINKYTLKFIADGNVVSETSVEYGSTITAPTAPTKTGYTFVSWGNVAATMPANDVTYTAQYSINQYTITFKVDGEVYKTFTLDYGAAITAPATPTKEGHTFDGWSTIPATMPANDVTVAGSFSPILASGITLNISTLSFTELNATQTLTATVSPANALNKSVTWTSSDANVATVDDSGLVTAKDYGTATITATTADGTNLSAMCEVTVLVNNKPDYYEIAEEPSATFELGKTYVLKNAFNGKFLSTNGGTATKVNQLENYEIWTIEAGSTADGTVYYRLATATVDGADKYFQYVNYGSKTWDDATPYDGYDWYEYAGFNGEFGPAETAQDFTILAPTASSDDSRTSVGDKTLVANSFVFTAKDEIMGKFFKLGTQGDNAALEPWREDVAWLFYEATPTEDADKALELALEAYGQLEMQGGDAPGFYPATAVEEYNGAVTAAREATNGDDAAKREAFAALKEAGKKTYETNPIVNGACYYIVSAGKGPGYYTTAEPEDPEKYNDEMAYGMYNADGFVNWGYFDYTQKYVYKFEKAEDGNWNIKNTADNSYIEKGTANYGQKVSTSATATMTQEFTLIKEGKFALTWTEDRSGKYIYTLTASHNGSKNGDAEPGTISVWGTAAEAAKYGVNVWYLIPVSEVKVSSISLDKAMLELTSIGQTSQLTATVLPAEATNKSITWTSSNTSVAIVDANGLVTAKGYGTAIITATTTDGSNKAATCAVTVATNVDLTGIAHWEVIYDASYGYTFKDIATGLYMNTKGNSSTHQAITYNVGQSDKGSCWKLLDSRGNNVVSFNTQENYYLYNLGGWQGGYAYENKDDQRIFILAPDLSSAEPIQFVSDGNGYYYICMNGKYVAQPTQNIEDLILKEITSTIATSISIDYSELSLEKGQTQSLKATVTPKEALQSVTWKSSNESVATVSENGLVTAKSNGTARITATTADGSNLSATCTVTVTIPVDGISLSNTSLTFSAIDSKETLTATVTPSNASNKNLEWTSSNPDVATVSSIVSSRGVVTAKGNGTATITARAKDGSNISASCTVTVTIPVDGISLSNTSLTFSALNTTQTLTATVSPSSAANKKLTWTSSNTSVATVSSNGVVTSKGNGTATITAKATDGSNISATCSVTVSAPILVTGVSLNKTSLTFSALNTTQTLTATVTPSSASNKILTWTSSNTDVATVNIYGVVTSKGYGTATITAKTTDGSNKSATCSVTVVIPKYTLKFVADGKVVSEKSVEYGSAITAPNAPAKTGYTFVSWGNVAATMPAKDVTYTAQYKVNQYKLTYMIDGRVYKTYTLDYNSVINPEGDAEDDDYYYGWEEIPDRMPDHDVTVNAYITGIAAAGKGITNGKYEIYTIDGKKLNNLQKGVNIIRLPNGKTKKVVIR